MLAYFQEYNTVMSPKSVIERNNNVSSLAFATHKRQVKYYIQVHHANNSRKFKNADVNQPNFVEWAK